MLLPSDRTTMGESLYVQCIKHISNTNSLVCHSVIHWWILINRNIQFKKKKLFYYLKTWVTFILGLKKMNTLNTDPEYHGKNQTIPHFALSLKGSISHIYTNQFNLLHVQLYELNIQLFPHVTENEDNHYFVFKIILNANSYLKVSNCKKNQYPVTPACIVI